MIIALLLVTSEYFDGLKAKDDCQSVRARERERDSMSLIANSRNSSHLIPSWQDTDMLEAP